METPKPITEVCKMLDMTSRTVRYYEQLGLIQTVRERRTAPRRLDSENIERLRKIRFLRKLGLALDEIAAVIDSDEKAAAMIESKSLDLQAEIAALSERIHLLEDVMTAVEKGGNIYDAEKTLGQPYDSPENLHIAMECIKLMLEGRVAEFMTHLNASSKRMPPEFFESAWNAHIAPCGKFLSFGEQYMDGCEIVTRLHFEKRGVIVKMNVCGGLVATIFLQYFNENA